MPDTHMHGGNRQQTCKVKDRQFLRKQTVQPQGSRYAFDLEVRQLDPNQGRGESWQECPCLRATHLVDADAIQLSRQYTTNPPLTCFSQSGCQSHA